MHQAWLLQVLCSSLGACLAALQHGTKNWSITRATSSTSYSLASKICVFCSQGLRSAVCRLWEKSSVWCASRVSLWSRFIISWTNGARPSLKRGDITMLPRRLPGHFCLVPTNNHCSSVNRQLIPAEAVVLVMRKRPSFLIKYLKPKICNNSIKWITIIVQVLLQQSIRLDLGRNCRLRRMGHRPRLQTTNECTVLQNNTIQAILVEDKYRTHTI